MATMSCKFSFCPEFLFILSPLTTRAFINSLVFCSSICFFIFLSWIGCHLEIYSCWLSMYEGIIWSMIGPICLIAAVSRRKKAFYKKNGGGRAKAPKKRRCLPLFFIFFLA